MQPIHADMILTKAASTRFSKSVRFIVVCSFLFSAVRRIPPPCGRVKAGRSPPKGSLDAAAKMGERRTGERNHPPTTEGRGRSPGGREAPTPGSRAAAGREPPGRRPGAPREPPAGAAGAGGKKGRTPDKHPPNGSAAAQRSTSVARQRRAKAPGAGGSRPRSREAGGPGGPGGATRSAAARARIPLRVWAVPSAQAGREAPRSGGQGPGPRPLPQWDF